MAHSAQINVNGVLTDVTEFDNPAQAIDDAVTALGAPTTPQAALSALGAGVRPNLLINGTLTANGVVNQVGGTSWASNGYTVDGWSISGLTSASIGDSGMSLVNNNTAQGYFTQKTDLDLSGLQLTMSALVNGNLYSGFITAPGIGNSAIAVTTPFGRLRMYCYSASLYGFTFDVLGGQSVANISDIKLEEGPNQTLAYQDSTGAWHRLPQPEDGDYAGQLLKCQRYLYNPLLRADDVAPVGYGFAVSNTTAIVYIPTPPMRHGVNSSLIFSGPLYIESTVGVGSEAIAVTNVQLNTQTDTLVKLLITGSNFPTGQGVGFQVRNSKSVLMFSKEL